jgi:hypothetical protein
VTLYYQVLRPDQLWLVDGNTRVALREVDALANAHRKRVTRSEPREAPRSTGLNAVEGTLKRLFHPNPSANTAGAKEAGEIGGDELEGGAPCARS